MFVSNALIGLREGLEAALVVVILLAFLKKTDRTWGIPYVWAGVGTAIALSVSLGAVLTFGTRQLTFEAQELVGGIASIIAVGLETAIFFYATAQAAGAGNNVPLLGWLVGFVGAIALGVLIYCGALRIDLGRFFRYTGIALIFVAGGILSYGIHDLQEAGLLPGLNTLAFDVSGVIDPGAWYAVLLKGTLNFTPATTVLQAIAWVLYVSTVLFFFLRRVSMTLVVSVAIPLSVIGTCVFMYLSGRSLNVLTMMGLMLGVDLSKPCGTLVQRAADSGLLISVTADSVIRLVPPLILKSTEADEMVAILVPLIRNFLAAPKP